MHIVTVGFRQRHRNSFIAKLHIVVLQNATCYQVDYIVSLYFLASLLLELLSGSVLSFVHMCRLQQPVENVVLRLLQHQVTAALHSF